MKTIPGLLEEMRYRRTGRHEGPYVHTFDAPAEIRLKASGGLDIEPLVPGTSLWSEDVRGERWLDNKPKRRSGMAKHRKHHGRHHHRHHRHNPFISAFNPGLAQVGHFFSVPYLSAGVSGITGFAVVGIGEYAVFNWLTFLRSYALGVDVPSIAVRGAGRLGIAFAGDALLGRVFSGHNRMAFAAGAAAYAVGATALELIGYSMSVGRGPALATILPAAFQPVAGLATYVDRPALRSLHRYVPRPRNGTFSGLHQMYMSPMHPQLQGG